MPRIRYLKPDFFSDEDLAELKYETRITFEGLWCYADKAGRLEDRPKFLKAMIFPYDNVDMEKQLEYLSKPKRENGNPFIIRYQVNGIKFIQILQWDKHQKPHHTEKESIFPPIPPLMEKGMEKGMGMGMGMGMEKQEEGSSELNNGEITVKEPQGSIRFDIFWNAYPKRRKKGDAERAWNKINPSNGLFNKIIAKVEEGKKSQEWVKDNGQFIPYPASWLNGKGWEDEYSPPPLFKPQPGIAALMESEGKKINET